MRDERITVICECDECSKIVEWEAGDGPEVYAGWVQIRRVTAVSDRGRLMPLKDFCPACVVAGAADLSPIEQAIVMSEEAR